MPTASATEPARPRNRYRLFSSALGGAAATGTARPAIQRQTSNLISSTRNLLTRNTVGAALLGKSYGKYGTVVPNPNIAIKGFQGSTQPYHGLH